MCTCEKAPSPVDYVSIPMLVRACVRVSGHLSGRPPPHCGGNSLLLIDCRDPGNPPRPHDRPPRACVLREASYPVAAHTVYGSIFPRVRPPKIVRNYRRINTTPGNSRQCSARLSHGEKQYVNNIARGIVLPDDTVVCCYLCRYW